VELEPIIGFDNIYRGKKFWGQKVGKREIKLVGPNARNIKLSHNIQLGQNLNNASGCKQNALHASREDRLRSKNLGKLL